LNFKCHTYFSGGATPETLADNIYYISAVELLKKFLLIIFILEVVLLTAPLLIIFILVWSYSRHLTDIIYFRGGATQETLIDIIYFRGGASQDILAVSSSGSSDVDIDLSDEVYEQAINLLQLVKTSCSRSSLASALFMEELAIAIREGIIHQKIEVQP